MTRRIALVLSIATALALPLAGRADAAPLTGATSMSSMEDHTCVRLSSGHARCWGANYDGEMGDGTDDQDVADVRTMLAPVGSAPLGGITQMAAGFYHSCALLQSGQVRCAGYDQEGQLGDGNASENHPRVRIVKNRLGTGALTGARGITAGERHTCALIEGGQVRCWGQNSYGELGIGTIGGGTDLPKIVRNVAGTGALTGVAQVDGGRSFTCARLTSGQVRCWGENEDGQLGDGSNTDSGLPVVVELGNGDPLTGVTQLSAGDRHVCVRLSSGQARCWGRGAEGQIGNGSADESTEPLAVERFANDQPLTNVSQVDAGGGHSCARMTDGTARCWGAGGEGQLGWDSTSGNLKPVTVVNPSGSGPLRDVRQIRTGSEFTCAVLQSGQVRCWGRDESGQLGDGPPQQSRQRPRVVVL